MVIYNNQKVETEMSRVYGFITCRDGIILDAQRNIYYSLISFVNNRANAIIKSRPCCVKSIAIFELFYLHFEIQCDTRILER